MLNVKIIMKRQIREVRILDLLTYSILSPLAIVLIWVATPIASRYVDSDFPYWCVYVAAALITYFPLKRSAIGAVLLYKVFAPMDVRRKCVFTPTCSTYMIMAIVKYGLFVGVYKGIRRLLRCHPPNGGEDYP